MDREHKASHWGSKTVRQTEIDLLLNLSTEETASSPFLSLCFNVCVVNCGVKQQKGFSTFTWSFHFHPLSVEVLSSSSPSPSFAPFSLYARLSSWPPHIFWFNQTCLGASPASHRFWSASQNSWARARLSNSVISLCFCLLCPLLCSPVSFQRQCCPTLKHFLISHSFISASSYFFTNSSLPSLLPPVFVAHHHV